MNKEELTQFKGVELNTKVASEYAKVRLGLVPEEWTAYAWSSCIDQHCADEVFSEIEDLLEDDDECIYRIKHKIEALEEKMCLLDPLPHTQMYVKLIKAPNMMVARELWDNESEVEVKVCLVDWELLQEVLK
jgi:hypothetical protein